MSDQCLIHIASDGERWDLLAWNYYGDPSLFAPIVMANPSIPIEPVLSAGMKIVVPVIEKTSVSNLTLPPWKQSK